LEKSENKGTNPYSRVGQDINLPIPNPGVSTPFFVIHSGVLWFNAQTLAWMWNWPDHFWTWNLHCGAASIETL